MFGDIDELETALALKVLTISSSLSHTVNGLVSLNLLTGHRGAWTESKNSGVLSA